MSLTKVQKEKILSKIYEFNDLLLNNKKSYDEVMMLLKEYLKPYYSESLSQEIMGRILILVAQPDKDGYSEPIKIDKLNEFNNHFRTKNGCSWARSDNSWLAKEFEIKRKKVGNSVDSIQLKGPSRNSRINKSIRKDIVENIKKQRCAVLDVSTNIECDHKDGKYDLISTYNDLSKQKTTDFQPLSKAVNDAKRQHCKTCKESHRRYDARILGFKEPFIKGDFDDNQCIGCYWYDPYEFIKESTKGFVNTKK